ncbi:hypothetical protein H8R03_33540 [Streptomyces sp. JH010]|nr:hypothetical protein [Streptomyces sp. JH010]MDF6066823.1 hypothetical protein [Streptomyces sp. JH010]
MIKLAAINLMTRRLTCEATHNWRATAKSIKQTSDNQTLILRERQRAGGVNARLAPAQGARRRRLNAGFRPAQR